MAGLSNFLLLFATLHLQWRETVMQQQQQRNTKPIMYLLNNGGYDPKIPPKFDEVGPAEVTVQLVVLSIDSVNEASMDYSLTIYLRQFWEDERLKFTMKSVRDIEQQKEFNGTGSASSPSGTTGRVNESWPLNDYSAAALEYFHTHDRLELDSRAKPKVWFPDTYFANEREARAHDVTMPNELLHIFPNGTVFSSMRISLTLTCHMRLEKYPFDNQDCPLIISSYGFTNHTVSYRWHEKDPVITKSGMELPTFELNEWNTVDCSEDEGSRELGEFSCLQLHVSLSRAYGYYIAQVYIPSTLMVILSWVNFWLDVTATPARISLGLLTVLTMTTMGVGAKNSLPRVSYIKAIDVWFSMCLVFVFAALLEFAFVNVTSRVQNRRLSMMDAVKMATEQNRAEKMQKSSVSFKTAASSMASASSSAKPLTNTNNGGESSRFGCLGRQTTLVSQRERARTVDKVARIVFPVTFTCFLIFYWCYYML